MSWEGTSVLGQNMEKYAGTPNSYTTCVEN